MFNTILYIDEEKLREYDSILKNRPNTKVNARTIERKARIGNEFIGGEGKIVDEANIETNVNYEYFRFETKAKELVSAEYFFDFTENDYDISTVSSNSLIKIRANAYVPKEFDTSKMLDEYANLIFQSMSGQPNIEIFKEMVERRQVKIPIIAQYEDDNFFMKIDMNKIRVDYEEFENLEDDESTIVGKKIRRKNNNVEIYNPYKDFLKIPRAMRRTIPLNQQNDGFEFNPIIRDEEFYEIEVLAIYR